MATKVPTAPPIYDDAYPAIQQVNVCTATPVNNSRSSTCCYISPKLSFDEALRAKGVQGSDIEFNNIIIECKLLNQEGDKLSLKVFIAPVEFFFIKKSKQKEFLLEPSIQYDGVTFKFWKSTGYLGVRIDGNEMKVVLELDKFVKIADLVRKKHYAIYVTDVCGEQYQSNTAERALVVETSTRPVYRSRRDNLRMRIT